MTPPETVEFIIHGPPGSAPPVLAEAFAAGVAEAAADDRSWQFVPRGDDPGVDSMNLMITRPGAETMISTCTPVFIQAPLLRGMALTHRDLTPVARLVADRFFLVCRADAPWADAADFLRDIGRRTTRTGGYFLGGINHLLSLSIAKGAAADVEFIVVPSEPAVWNGLIEGTLDWGCGVAAEILPHVEAGTLRVLAALDDARLPAFPDVPTLGEAGVPVTFQLWRGLMAPPGVSPEAQARWHAIIEKVRGTRAWADYLARNGQADAYLPGPAFCAFLDREWDWYRSHLGLAGLLPG
ncbi:tripartite tricarboxylate transporter substrate-binding protein [Neotabrizicola sp. VNH66]|uniref:tripartite tricarboxylate transporter substrate-binding protein n=1 Tax=Neotabrizicola sp. VNH66 TaxID=3400918 RepID=UPI003C1118E2